MCVEDCTGWAESKGTEEIIDQRTCEGERIDQHKQAEAVGGAEQAVFGCTDWRENHRPEADRRCGAEWEWLGSAQQMGWKRRGWRNVCREGGSGGGKSAVDARDIEARVVHEFVGWCGRRRIDRMDGAKDCVVIVQVGCRVCCRKRRCG